MNGINTVNVPDRQQACDLDCRVDYVFVSDVVYTVLCQVNKLLVQS